MVRIRLRRAGARNKPSYRMVAADQNSARDGRFLEVLGHYNPRDEPATIVVDEARMLHWLGKGAQPSDTMARLLGVVGTMKRFDRLKAGEALDALLAEAALAAAQPTVPAPRAPRPTKKTKAAAAAAAATAAAPTA